MSETRFTPSQREAIERRGEAVLVSAGAGSGKTTVLVNRLVEYIKSSEDINIDDFVIITFTKAAANELRSKISTELSKEALNNPQNKHMRRQLALCSKAKIGTIHSFCAQLLRQYSKQAGISPDFKILSDERRNLIRENSLNKVLDRYYSEMDLHEGFESLANSVSTGSGDDSLAALVLSLHNSMLTHPEPSHWAQMTVDALEMDVSDAGQTIWGKEIMEEALNKALFWQERLQYSIQQIQVDDKLKNAYFDNLSFHSDFLEKLSGALSTNWDMVRNVLSDFESPRLSPYRGTNASDIAEEARGAKKGCSEYIKKLQDVFRSPSSTLISEMKSTTPSMKALLNLTLDFDRQFCEDKAKLRLLDYNDLEHITYDTLQKNPDLKAVLSNRYVEILVDEYQDVNGIQDAIFTSISDNGKKLFMVGDIKQSIYRFRLADPTIFINKCEKVKPISLSENFRSRREIIDAVNLIFEKCMSKQLGDVEYDDDAKLKFGATGYSGSVPGPELLLFEREEDDEKYSFEASCVGQKILELVKDGYRFGDITILMRSLSVGASIYCDEFTKLGIPVESSQSGSFFERCEVADIVNTLKTIDNPFNDISLLATLRTYSFTADELSEIRLCDKGHNLFTALSKCDNQKCRAFTEMLEKWRTDARQMTMDRFLMSLNLPVSPNFLKLVEMAVAFENEGYHGLHRFVKYLQRISSSGAELSSINSASDAVHIMSIHKSKGLEFPVVFLCDTDHSFNFADSRTTVLVHPQLGLGPKYCDSVNLVQYPTLARNAIAARLSKEQRSEELRLLYVALTRARERLYMTASPTNIDKTPKPLLGDANSYLDWLLVSPIPRRIIRHNPSTADEVCAEATEEVFSSVPEIDYPYKEAVSIPASVTATELKKLVSDDSESLNIAPSQYRFFRKPDFTKKKSEASASDRGSAMHKALEHIDFSNDLDLEILRLKEAHFITDMEYEIIDRNAIRAFLDSPLGKRIQSGSSLRREFKFLLIVDARDLLDVGSDEKILLNGIVDCCFEEDGEIVIVDYKTDHTDRTDEYAPQIKAYALALERIYKKKVKDAYLYYLNLGYEKRIPV